MNNNKNYNDVAAIVGAGYLAEKGFQEGAFFLVQFFSDREIVEQCDKIIEKIERAKFVFQCNEEDEDIPY